MDLKKDQEREELHRAIWSIADNLRGKVDGWDFKQYILGIMFYRFISENLADYIDNGEKEANKNSNFEYAKLADEECNDELIKDLVETKGFFIYPSELFCNLVKEAREIKKNKEESDINIRLSKIFDHIESSAAGTDSEQDFKGLFADIDVNSVKLGKTLKTRNELLCNLLIGIDDMKLGNYKDNTIDAFGDAYEYLMSMYASKAGKSGGEFFTPQEVSELLARLTIVGKTEVNKVYDPACGSGSLLLKFAKILGKDNVRGGFFGQEVNPTTYNLCRINMFLHDIDYDKFNIAWEDTLLHPQHEAEAPFDCIVSNPPYSIPWVGDDDPTLINNYRYSPAGILAPKANSDYAFIMHSLSQLDTDGTAAIVCFPGIMYRKGAEKKIREYLVNNNKIDTIIQLPDNLFFGTSIVTDIMVLKHSKKDNNVLFIDASLEFVKVTNSNKLTEENIQNILNLYIERKSVPHVASLVSQKDIELKKYDLSVSTYVEKETVREVIDIDKVNKEILEVVKKENALRTAVDNLIKEL